MCPPKRPKAPPPPPVVAAPPPPPPPPPVADPAATESPGMAEKLAKQRARGGGTTSLAGLSGSGSYTGDLLAPSDTSGRL